MKTKYTELFSLQVLQPFYLNHLYAKTERDPVPGLKLVPTAECMNTLKRIDGVFRTVDELAGCMAFTQTITNSGGDLLLRFPPRAGQKLSFWVIQQNPALVNTSDLPVQRTGKQVYFFHNRHNDPAAPRNELHLTSAAAGVDATTDLANISTSAYAYHHNAPVAAGTATIEHLLTGTLVQPQSIMVQAGESDLTFNLAGSPTGMCRLLISGVEKDVFYHAGPVIPGSLFAVVELSLSALPAANYNIIETGDILLPGRPQYVIKLNNRKTLWRYNITLDMTNPIYLALQAMSPADRATFISQFKVTSPDPAITFTQVWEDGATFRFQSDNEMLLREKYEGLTIQLKKLVGQPGEAVVKEFLPFPQVDRLDALGYPTVYSDIFLTL